MEVTSERIKDILRKFIAKDRSKTKKISFYESQYNFLTENKIAEIKALNEEAESLLYNSNGE